MATSASSAVVASSFAYHRRRFSPSVIYSSKPTLLISCATPSFPSKPTRRNNYLRKKILKTLKPPLTPNPSPIPIDTPPPPPPPEEFIESGTISEILESDDRQNSELQNVEELGTVEVSVPAAGNAVDASIGVLAKKSIWQYGLWLIGAFVFQTVCAVWVFTSSDAAAGGVQNEVLTGNEGSSVNEVGGDGKDKSRLVRVVLKGKENGRMGVNNGAAESVVYIDEAEMERKVEEIRVLAREAREKERLELKKSGYDSEDGEEDDVDERKDSKSGLEEEVDNRLIKLRNKLEIARPLKVGVGKCNGEKDESNGKLLFKKKYKFKDSAVDLVGKPKGFRGLNGSDDSRTDVDSVRSDDGILDEEESRDQEVSNVSESMKGSWRNVDNERGTSKQGKGRGAPKPKLVNGTSFWNLRILD